MQSCFITILVQLLCANTAVDFTGQWQMPSVKCNIFYEHCHCREEYFVMLWNYPRPIANVFTHICPIAIHSYCSYFILFFYDLLRNLMYVTHTYTHILYYISSSAFALLAHCTLKIRHSLKGVSAWGFCSCACVIGVRYSFEWVKSCSCHFISRWPHLLSVWIL